MAAISRYVPSDEKLWLSNKPRPSCWTRAIQSSGAPAFGVNLQTLA